MEPSCPLGTTRCIPQAKFHQKPCNKSFIDQVCSVKMAGYWPRSFFCEFMDLDFVSVHKHAKKNLANIHPAILTSHLVNNPYILTDIACPCDAVTTVHDRPIPSNISGNKLRKHFHPKTCYSASQTNQSSRLQTTCLLSIS